MNPLDRRLRQRKILLGRLSAAALLVCIGSAGIIVPRIIEYRDVHRGVDQELLLVGERLERGRTAEWFQIQGLPRLAEAEQRLLEIAPLGPLPPDFRGQIKTRLEALGVRIDAVALGEPQSVAAADPAEEEDAPSAYGYTPVTISGASAFEPLPALLRQIATGVPPGLVLEAMIRRDLEAFPQVSFSLVVGFLHTQEYAPEQEEIE